MSSTRGRECLDENVVAEFLQGLLSGEKVDMVEAHVDRCAQCRELVVAVSRSWTPWSEGARSQKSGETHVPETGEVIADKYRVEGVIGSGGMGVVLAATHLLLNRTVALKLMRIDALDSDEGVQRFMREARASIPLKSEHATRVMDLGIMPSGAPYIVMEHLQGQDLGRIVARKGPLTVGIAASFLVQACEAIAEAHGLGIVHRDIKPSNLFLTRGMKGEACIKVLDFGLSKVHAESDLPLTNTRVVMGSPFFMAPEQLLAAREVDARADLWGLGATLQFLITGRPPFEAETLPELSAAVLRDRPHALPPTVPPRLAEILSSCLEKDPGRRIAGAAELAEALTPFAAAAPRRATAKREPRRLAPVPEPVKPPKRRTGILIACTITLLVIGGVILATRFQGGAPPRRPPVVVLMDTAAEKGVYDKDTPKGGTNADVLSDALRDLLVNLPVKEALPSSWNREEYIVELRPDLVVVHRSALFHPLNEELEFAFGKPPFADEKAKAMWERFYDSVDDKLIGMIGFVGTLCPQTRFLVYSRGTDERWLDPDWRAKWVEDIEQRFKKLKGRIDVMTIDGGLETGTFKHHDVREKMRSHVKRILGLAEKKV